MSRKATPGLDSVTRLKRAFLLACLPTLFVPAMAAGDLCGTTIVDDLTLDHDLSCSGDGLIVGADGIKIDLKGHTITGSGVGVGIGVTGRTNVSIMGGIVENFLAGVLVSNSSGIVIKRSEFRGRCRRCRLFGRLRWDHHQGEQVPGQQREGDHAAKFYARQRGQGEYVHRKPRRHPPVRCHRHHREGKHCIGKPLAGIRINVLASGNLVKENTVSSNPAGIEFLRTPTGSATGNTVVENTIATNTCGLKGPLVDNTVSENLFDRNVTDICP